MSLTTGPPTVKVCVGATLDCRKGMMVAPVGDLCLTPPLPLPLPLPAPQAALPSHAMTMLQKLILFSDAITGLPPAGEIIWTVALVMRL